MEIRLATADDWPSIWPIIQSIISRGDTYAFDPDSSEETMKAIWCGSDKATYVAVADGKVVGTFFMKPNQPGLGAHIANAGYMVADDAAGKGVGRAMAEFSIKEAHRLGYDAMQFNIVIKSNTRAVELWKRLGFAVIGEIPDAFRHRQLGMTNAYIMYRKV